MLYTRCNEAAAVAVERSMDLTSMHVSLRKPANAKQLHVASLELLIPLSAYIAAYERNLILSPQLCCACCGFAFE